MEVPAQLFTISEAAVLLHVPEGWLRKKVSALSELPKIMSTCGLARLHLRRSTA